MADPIKVTMVIDFMKTERANGRNVSVEQAAARFGIYDLNEVAEIKGDIAQRLSGEPDEIGDFLVQVPKESPIKVPLAPQKAETKTEFPRRYNNVELNNNKNVADFLYKTFLNASKVLTDYKNHTEWFDRAGEQRRRLFEGKDINQAWLDVGEKMKLAIQLQQNVNNPKKFEQIFKEITGGYSEDSVQELGTLISSANSPLAKQIPNLKPSDEKIAQAFLTAVGPDVANTVKDAVDLVQNAKDNRVRDNFFSPMGILSTALVALGAVMTAPTAVVTGTAKVGAPALAAAACTTFDKDITPETTDEKPDPLTVTQISANIVNLDLVTLLINYFNAQAIRDAEIIDALNQLNDAAAKNNQLTETAINTFKDSAQDLLNAIAQVGKDVTDSINLLKVALNANTGELIALLVSQNQLLKDFKDQEDKANQVDQMNQEALLAYQDKLLEELMKIKQGQGQINTFLEKTLPNLPDDIRSALSTDLNEILAAIKDNTTQVSANGDTLNIIKTSIISAARIISAQLSVIIKQNNISIDNQNKIKELLNKIISNQNSDATTQMSQNELLLAMMELMTLINGGVQDINKKLDDVISSLKQLCSDSQAVQQKLDTLHTDNEQIKNQLNMVLGTIESALQKLSADLRNEFKPYFEQMILGIKSGNDINALNGKKLDELKNQLQGMNDFLQVINQTIINGNEEQIAANKENAKRFLAALSAIGFNMTSGMAALYQAIVDGNTTLAGKLDTLIGKVDENTGEIKNLGDTLNKISNYAKSIDAKFSYYGNLGTQLGEQLLEAIATLTNKTQDNFNNVSALIQSVISNQNLSRAQVENLISMLKVLNSNVEIVNSNIVSGNEQQHKDAMEILNAIKGVGFAVTSGMDGIMKAVMAGNCQKDTIIKLLKDLGVKADAQAGLTQTQIDIANKILEAIGNIELNPQINVNVDLDSLVNKVDEIIDAIKTNGGKIDTTNNLLVTVANLISNVDANNEARTEKILAAILAAVKAAKTNGDKLDDINNNVTALSQLISKVDANNEERFNKLMAVIAKLGINIAVHLNTIAGKLDNNEQWNKLFALLEKMDANNETRNQKLLDAIARLGAGIIPSLTAIANDSSMNEERWTKLFALLAKMDANQEARNAKIIDEIKRMGIDLASSAAAIIEQIGNNGNKLDKFYKLLQKMDANNETRNQKLLAAIALLGDKIPNIDFSVIESKLTELTNVVKNMDDNNTSGQEAILAAILKLNCDMITEFNSLIQLGARGNSLLNEIATIVKNLPQTDYTEQLNSIKGLITNINNNVNKGNGWLEAIYNFLGKIQGNLNKIYNKIGEGNQNYNEILNKIFNKLSTIDSNNSANFAALIQVIANKEIPATDLSVLINKLDMILEKIKNHDVTVTVDAQCHCHCTNGQGQDVTEEVLGDLYGILG